MEAIFLIIFLLGLPRSLWCIPAFVLIWYGSGGSSGGASGSGDNIGYLSLPFVMFAIAAWGAFVNIRKSYAKISAVTLKDDDAE